MTHVMTAPEPPWSRVDWGLPPGVQAWQTWCGTTRGADFNLATHAGPSVSAALANREALRAALPGQPSITWLRQVHGTGVVELPGPARAEADAAFTRAPRCACVIMTADCLPVLFTAEDGSVVAAAHAGWRGLAAGVLESTVAAMSVSASGLRAWLGPAIGPEAFEVGPEVRAAFVQRDPDAAAAFQPSARPGHYHADLALLAARRLRALGIHDITAAGICTYTEVSRCASHRRNPQSGRMASLIWRDAV